MFPSCARQLRLSACGCHSPCIYFEFKTRFTLPPLHENRSGTSWTTTNDIHSSSARRAVPCAKPKRERETPPPNMKRNESRWNAVMKLHWGRTAPVTRFRFFKSTVLPLKSRACFHACVNTCCCSCFICVWCLSFVVFIVCECLWCRVPSLSMPFSFCRVCHLFGNVISK